MPLSTYAYSWTSTLFGNLTEVNLSQPLKQNSPIDSNLSHFDKSIFCNLIQLKNA